MAEFSRRDFIKVGLLASTAVGAGLSFPNVLRAQETVKIGVLHSLSGTMAISEVSLRDVVLMAVEEINAKGGVMGKKISPVVVDPASNWDLFAEGVTAANIEEEYKPFNHQDYQTIVGKIKRFSSGGGACVLSTINGDSNVPFYKEFANQGLRSENAPIMAYSVAEDELRGMDTSALVGHLAAWNYFQSVENAANKKFVNAFKEYAQKNNLPGGSKRVTDDPMEAAYFGVHIWKQAVEKAKSFEVDAVRKAVYGQTFAAPGGQIKMDEANQHTYKPVLIGEILKDGQFKVVSRSKGLVKADPWSQYTSPDK